LPKKDIDMLIALEQKSMGTPKDSLLNKGH
jgi:hypothetical protein